MGACGLGLQGCTTLAAPQKPSLMGRMVGVLSMKMVSSCSATGTPPTKQGPIVLDPGPFAPALQPALPHKKAEPVHTSARRSLARIVRKCLHVEEQLRASTSSRPDCVAIANVIASLRSFLGQLARICDQAGKLEERALGQLYAAMDEAQAFVARFTCWRTAASALGAPHLQQHLGEVMHGVLQALAPLDIRNERASLDLLESTSEVHADVYSLRGTFLTDATRSHSQLLRAAERTYERRRVRPELMEQFQVHIQLSMNQERRLEGQEREDELHSLQAELERLQAQPPSQERDRGVWMLQQVVAALCDKRHATSSTTSISDPPHAIKPSARLSKAFSDHDFELAVLMSKRHQPLPISTAAGKPPGSASVHACFDLRASERVCSSFKPSRSLLTS